VRLEGVIAFDRGDGLLRNELASHIYYDKEAKEWRGLTVGMSAYYDVDKRIGKQLWAISSKKDPRFGFSIMKAKPVILPNSSEGPHYAANNDKEYFAEGTEAYFYRNDFYPFVRAELKEHDPVLHDLLEEIWGPMK